MIAKQGLPANNQLAQPFSYSYSPGFPELLLQLKCSLAISTYQTGKVVIFSSKDEDRLIQLPRTFQRPMGMALDGERWAIVLQNEIIVTYNEKVVVAGYPPNPAVYDALFVPRITYHTGGLDLHDIDWCDQRLVGVNTLFSCLAEFGDAHSFRPIWKPSFVTALVPEDRCHLNGLATHNGHPKYVTALGKTDAKNAWKDQMLEGGVLIDIESNEIILDDLPVPHSPRMYGEELYMLLSATGELVKVDVRNRKYEVITRLNGFLRGMDRIGDHLFVAMSKIRKGSSFFKEADIAKQSVHCGISVIHLPTGTQVGYLVYQNAVEELFDVKILSGLMRPNLLNLDKRIHENMISTSHQAFWNQTLKNH